MSNCGLKALEQMAKIKNTSMFSLIHLAKDNGVNLYFCKVEPEELISVTRPAIFHQKNHFVFVEDGQAMPAGEYDGYVLTPKPLHEPLPYALAKKIRGAKKGGDILGPIAVGIGSIINPFLGAALGAGLGIHQTTGGSGVTGKKGEFWRIPLGAATGYLQGAPTGSTFGIGNAKLAGALAAAGEVPGAIKSGNWMAPIAAGVGQYMGAQAIGGAKTGMANAAPGFFSQTKGALTGAMGAFTGGNEVAANAAGGVGPSGGGYADSFRLTGALPGRTPAGSMLNLPGIGTPGVTGTVGGSGAANLAGGGSGDIFSKITKFLPGGGGGTSGMSWLGTAASALLPPPKQTLNMGDNYSKAAQYIGGENWKALPEATRRQLEEFTNMSIEDLSTKFMQGTDKQLNDLALKKQQAIDAIMTQYANYGQDPYTSTDAQQRLTEINRQYDQAATELKQQAQNQATQQAIAFKQDILHKSIQQGQFDNDSFLQLAALYGMDQEAKDAMANADYEAMQRVLGQIFSMGTQQGG